MVPDYDDDEIIEDYDEVNKSDSGVRYVASGQGGPVRRPSGGVRPSTSVMPGLQDDPDALAAAEERARKGKITKKSARNIWIICIAICVLGVGAVVADLIFGFTKGDPPPNKTNENKAAGGPQKGKTGTLTERQKLENEFTTAVINHMKEIDSTKAWDFYWVSVLEFDDAWDKANKLKRADDSTSEQLEEAWAEAIKQYYKVRYATTLFRWHFGEFDVDYLAINMQNRDEYTQLREEDLKSEEIRRFQAAASKLDARSTRINRFQPDVLKSDLTASNVHLSKEWAERVFGEMQAKASKASNREFDQVDIDFIKSPDYKSGEKKLFEKYLEQKQSEG